MMDRCFLLLTLPFSSAAAGEAFGAPRINLWPSTTHCFSKNPQSKMEILSFENIGTGTVWDISYDGSTLLLLNTTERGAAHHL